MSGSGWEALLDVWELLGSSPGYTGVVGRLFRMSGRPSRMSGSIRNTLLDLRES